MATKTESIGSSACMDDGANRGLPRRRRRHDLPDADRRRSDAAHRKRPVDHRVEAGDGRGAAAVAGCVAGRVRRLQADSAIPRAQRGHDAQPVQDDLLVGVDASAARAHRRHGVPAAVPLLSLARHDPEASQMAPVGHLRRRRRAWRGRLVDGVLGARRHQSRQRVAVPAGIPPDARLRHLRWSPARAPALPTTPGH